MNKQRVSNQQVSNHWTTTPAQPKPDTLAQALRRVVEQAGKPIENAKPGIALDSPAGHILHIMEQGAGSIKIIVSAAGNRLTDAAYTRVSEEELSELTAYGAIVREDGSDIATYILPGHRKSAQVQETRRATSADLGWDEKTGRYTDAANRGNR